MVSALRLASSAVLLPHLAAPAPAAVPRRPQAILLPATTAPPGAATAALNGITGTLVRDLRPGAAYRVLEALPRAPEDNRPAATSGRFRVTFYDAKRTRLEAADGRAEGEVPRGAAFAWVWMTRGGAARVVFEQAPAGAPAPI